MTLSNLPADDLAKIDAVCLQFEYQLRSGAHVSVEEMVARHAGLHTDVLRNELRAVEAELISEGIISIAQTDSSGSPRSVSGSPPDISGSPVDRSGPPRWPTTPRSTATPHAPATWGSGSHPGSADGSPASGDPGTADKAGMTPSAGSAMTQGSATASGSATTPSPDPADTKISDRSPPLGAMGRNRDDIVTLDGQPLVAASASRPAAGADSRVAPGSSLSDEMRLPPPGEMLGPYEIEERIDQGGMGVVYRAIDTRLRRDVAVKLLTPSLSSRADLVERFDRENRSVAAISHPNIVELFDVGRYGQVPYAVMEFLRGRTLGETIRTSRLPTPRVIEIGLALSDALSTAHAAGIIHRDLKPHNVMLVPRDSRQARTPTPSQAESRQAASIDQRSIGQSTSDRPTGAPGTQVDGTVGRGENGHREDSGPVVKVFDFGLSRLDPDSHPGQGAPDQGTVEGTILGTPGYMAPEQIHGDRATPKVDLFALGAILFEAWTGEQAFVGTTRSQRFASTLESPVQIPVTLSKSNPEVASIILRCLEKDPASRPDSALEVNRALRNAWQKSQSTSRSVLAESSGGLNRRSVLVAAGGLAASAAGLSAFYSWMTGPTTIERLAVLSFRESGFEAPPGADSAAVDPTGPVGDRELRRGEQISTLLIRELSRLPGLSLPAFRPMVAESPGDYVRLGTELGVDALLDGEVATEVRGSKKFLRWDLRLVDARTGDERWRHVLTTSASESLLEQTRVARQIAEKIGMQLVPTAEQEQPPDSSAFSCLISGTARSDPDSTEGLDHSLMCFSDAIAADKSFPDPVGGMALAAMQLASRQFEPARTGTLLRVAQERIDQVLDMDATSREGRLADGMFRWQVLADFQAADSVLAQLRSELPRDWQVLHQSGLLSMAIGDLDQAIDHLLKASLLNPLSVLARIDLARATWYAGDSMQALQDARAVADRTGNHAWALGLIIDIYEHQEKYSLAAAADPDIAETASASGPLYFAARQRRIKALPYGPFGGVCNDLLWNLRADPVRASASMSTRPVPMPPMLFWLVASHPASEPLRSISWIHQILSPAFPA